MAERAYFLLCLTVGRVLRSAKYSRARVVHQDGACHVQKRRLFYAPLLVWLGRPVMRILDTGVRVLPQPEWEERERNLYRRFYGTSIQRDADGMLILPYLGGETLATLLDNQALEASARRKAIEGAVVALGEFHRLGFTHGDAMAENVMVDDSRGTARWFDFETLHDASRSPAWRRADDLRALLVTCLVRTAPEKRAGAVQLILDAYDDHGVTRVLAAQFASVWRRALTFHLAQAPLSFPTFREIAGLLNERTESPTPRG